jgi:hypothetical protein
MEPLGVETLQPLRPALQPPAFPQQPSAAAAPAGGHGSGGGSAAAAALAKDPLLQHFTFQRSWLADSLQ